MIFAETFDIDLTAVQNDILDKASEAGELAESEMEDPKTTCSVVFDDSDSLALDQVGNLADDEYDDSDCDSDDFEFISKDDL